MAPFGMKDSRYLVSVGKDRQLRIWKHLQNCEYECCCCYMKSHGRIIWDVSICYECDEFVLFATGSRDMTVKLWCFTCNNELNVF